MNTITPSAPADHDGFLCIAVAASTADTRSGRKGELGRRLIVVVKAYAAAAIVAAAVALSMVALTLVLACWDPKLRAPFALSLYLSLVLP